MTDRNSCKNFVFLLLIALFWSLSSIVSATTTSSVLRIRLQDVSINPVVAQYIQDSLLEAENAKQPLLIEMDTPGGLLRSTRDIVKVILSARVPVIVYVAPDGSRAASAGVFITMAAHVAAMAPATNIGAAHPVGIGGSWPTPPDSIEALTSSTQTTDFAKTLKPQQATDVMSDKVMNDTLAWVQGIAEMRGRNADWARLAVEKSESLVATRAAELHVVDMVCSSTEELLRRVDGRQIALHNDTTVTLTTAGATILDRPMTQTQDWLNMLADPSLAYILFLAGVGLIFYELTHFGLLIPGITGSLCLLLAAFAFQILPINYAALFMLVLGIGCIVAELKFTSYGILTVVGIFFMWFGAVGLVDTAPGFPGIAKSLISSVTFSAAGIMILLVSLVVRSLRQRVSIGVESMAGTTATVMTSLSPRGKVEYDGTYWDAVCSDGSAKVGDIVELERIDGLLLYVKLKPESKKSTGQEKQ